VQDFLSLCNADLGLFIFFICVFTVM
jgi:hypothetical protein